MDKNLSERIAARTVKKKPVLSHSGQNRAAFLALRPDIKQALVDGWSIKSIWETLHEEGKVTFSYSAFRGYANRLILSTPISASYPSEQKSNTETTKPNRTDPETSELSKIGGFVFNATPKKEDLI